MSCGSSLNIDDSTLLSGCPGSSHDHETTLDHDHDDTALYNMIDSTILAVCHHNHDDSTLLDRVLLKHDSKADAIDACKAWCKDHEQECKTSASQDDEGHWHWTKPEGCKISCSWRNKK